MATKAVSTELFIELTCQLLEGLQEVFPECANIPEVEALFKKFVLGKPSREALFMKKWNDTMSPLYQAQLFVAAEYNALRDIVDELTAEGHRIGVHLLNYDNPCVLIAKMDIATKIRDPDFDQESQESLFEFLKDLTEKSQEAYGNLPARPDMVSEPQPQERAPRPRLDPPRPSGTPPPDMQSEMHQAMASDPLGLRDKLSPALMEKAEHAAVELFGGLHSGDIRPQDMTFDRLAQMGQSMMDGMDPEDIQDFVGQSGAIFNSIGSAMKDVDMGQLFQGNPMMANLLQGGALANLMGPLNAGQGAPANPSLGQPPSPTLPP